MFDKMLDNVIEHQHAVNQAEALLKLATLRRREVEQLQGKSKRRWKEYREQIGMLPEIRNAILDARAAGANESRIRRAYGTTNASAISEVMGG